MKIKKVTDRAELNVSAQGCHNDCTYYKGQTRYVATSNTILSSWCKKVTDARWCKWW